MSRNLPDITVRLSSTGVAGDSGKWTSIGLLITDDEWTLQSLWASKEAYRLATSSRLVLRVPTHLQLSQSPSLQTMAYGIDLRCVVPPLFPYGRNSDGTFTLFHSLINTQSCIAHVPAAIIHSPRFGALYGVSHRHALTSVRISDWIGMLLNDAVRALSPNAQPSLEHIGSYLKEISAIDDDQLLEKVQRLLSDRRNAQVRAVTTLLSKYDGSPTWRSDLQAIIAKLERHRFQPIECMPLEYGEADMKSMIKTMKRAVGLYGLTVCAWSTLVANCRPEVVDEIVELDGK